jgi:hypothetical protein
VATEAGSDGVVGAASSTTTLERLHADTNTTNSAAQTSFLIGEHEVQISSAFDRFT